MAYYFMAIEHSLDMFFIYKKRKIKMNKKTQKR